MFPRSYFPRSYFAGAFFPALAGLIIGVLVQARSGIARSGATRSGYVFQVPVILTVGGSDMASSIIASSLTVTLVLNDQPDTCRFTMKPGAVIPTVGQLISVEIASAGNQIFAGQIARITRNRRVMPTAAQQAPFVDVECVDFTALFDRRMINFTYQSISATAIAKDIIANWTSGFTSVWVQSGLPTVDFFPLTNEKPSAALRRLVNLMGGGGFYIDGARNVHLFGTAGDPSIGPAQILMNTADDLQAFAVTADLTQIRNRVISEGQNVAAAVDQEAGATTVILASGAFDFPDPSGYIRIGTTRYQYSSYVRLFGGFSHGPAPFGAITTSTALASVGATSIAVADVTSFNIGGTPPNQHYLFVDGQYLNYTGASAGSGPGTITGIPATGFGSIQTDLPSGTVVQWANYLKDLSDMNGVATSLQANLKQGDPIISFVVVDNVPSQTALAAIEGGDGIHEHVVQDGRLNIAGATDRAQQDLTAFSAAGGVITLNYETDALNATVGAQQPVNFTTTDPLSTTLTITQVEITFPVPNRRPHRRCQATSVILAEVPDMAQLEGA